MPDRPLGPSLATQLQVRRGIDLVKLFRRSPGHVVVVLEQEAGDGDVQRLVTLPLQSEARCQEVVRLPHPARPVAHEMTRHIQAAEAEETTGKASEQSGQ